jgi:membrane protease YdiL (CAAX protease family)
MFAAAFVEQNPARCRQLIDRSLPGPDWRDAILWVLCVLVWSWVFGLLGEHIGAVLQLGFAQLGQGATRIVAMLGALGLIAGFAGRDFARQVALRGVGLGQALLIVLFALPLSIASDVVQQLAEVTRPHLRIESMLAGSGGQDPWHDGFLYACVLVPVCEEIFFRGFLGRGLMARYGVWAGVLVTSGLYGVFGMDLLHAGPRFVRALGYHAVYLSTKSILAPILLHALCNGLAFSVYMDNSASLKCLAVASIGVLVALLWRSQTVWRLPDAETWRPPYASAEMPPASLHAVASVRRPGWLWLAVAAGAYLLFAAGLGSRLASLFQEDAAMNRPTPALRR